MRTLTSILLAALLCNATTSAGEDADTKSRETAANPAAQKNLSAAESKTVAPHNALFDQLVGTWDVAYEIFDKDGKVRRYRGQVRYSWILDGQALQEIWTSDSEDDEDPRPYGTTINFYDPKRQRWTAVWVYPSQGMTTIVTGGEVNGSFVLTGHDESGALQRWSTSAVQSDSVVGRFDISSDDGKTWRAVGVNHMQRHRG